MCVCEISGLTVESLAPPLFPKGMPAGVSILLPALLRILPAELLGFLAKGCEVLESFKVAWLLRDYTVQSSLSDS